VLVVDTPRVKTVSPTVPALPVCKIGPMSVHPLLRRMGFTAMNDTW